MIQLVPKRNLSQWVAQRAAEETRVLAVVLNAADNGTLSPASPWYGMTSEQIVAAWEPQA